MEVCIVCELGGRSRVFLGQEVEGWGFDVTAKGKKFSGKEGVGGVEGGRKGKEAAGVCELTAVMPSTKQT